MYIYVHVRLPYNKGKAYCICMGLAWLKQGWNELHSDGLLLFDIPLLLPEPIFYYVFLF